MRLTPELVVQAYASGIFPMAESRWGPVSWIEPRNRGILEFDQLRVSRSLRKVVNSGRFLVTYNRAFGKVIGACAERESTWISHEIELVYQELHRRGVAHSVEVWEGGRLCGGLYGVALGGAFFGESMFHRTTDSSKVALVQLVMVLESRGFQLLDLQFLSSHLRSMGGTEIPQEEYVKRLDLALELDVSFHDEGCHSGVLACPAEYARRR